MSSGSTDETFGLDEQTIRELLEALDAKLADRDVAGEIYVVGGSAMLLEYGATRSTNDIDCAITRGQDAIYEAAAEIASETPGIPADWLNETASITHNIPEDPDGDARTSFQGSHLTVKTASADRMLAMKIHAGRPSDLEDLEQLVGFTSTKTGSNAKALTEHHFPHDDVMRNVVDLVDQIIKTAGQDRHEPNAAGATGSGEKPVVRGADRPVGGARPTGGNKTEPKRGR